MKGIALWKQEKKKGQLDLKHIVMQFLLQWAWSASHHALQSSLVEALEH